MLKNIYDLINADSIFASGEKHWRKSCEFSRPHPHILFLSLLPPTLFQHLFRYFLFDLRGEGEASEEVEQVLLDVEVEVYRAVVLEFGVAAFELD